MNDKQMAAFLASPMKIAEKFQGGGWRGFVPTRYVPLYDDAIIGGAEAIREALTGPSGWAFRLWNWSQERKGKDTPNRTGLYPDLTTPAIAYMVVDLREAGRKVGVDVKAWSS